MLQVAQSYLKEKYDCYFINSFAENLPFKNDTFDVIIVFNAIHHFDFRRFIREARRVLKPRGFLFIYTRTQEQNRNSIGGNFSLDFQIKNSAYFGKTN
jgi:ubiquinone/menaquinone biosynthesis C-methylase UbiE